MKSMKYVIVYYLQLIAAINCQTEIDGISIQLLIVLLNSFRQMTYSKDQQGTLLVNVCAIQAMHSNTTLSSQQTNFKPEKLSKIRHALEQVKYLENVTNRPLKGISEWVSLKCVQRNHISLFSISNSCVWFSQTYESFVIRDW